VLTPAIHPAAPRLCPPVINAPAGLPMADYPAHVSAAQGSARGGGRWLRVLAAILGCLSGAAPVPGAAEGAAPATVGFERVLIPRADGPALEGAFWYPSASPEAAMQVGRTEQNVANAGALVGRNLPLVVISHGALSNAFGHADTAVALAQAGFVVAAVSHAELSPSFTLQLAARPPQLSALISFALHDWHFHAALNPDRIGAFGYSAGAFTVLVAAGGVPDVGKIAPHCRAAPAEWSCVMAARHRLDLAETPMPRGAWGRDGRIKAASIAAPAAGYLFDTSGLEAVRIPVQLWQAGDDQTVPEPWSVTPIREGLPGAPEFHFVRGAGHRDFGAPCAASVMASHPSLCRDASGFDRAAFHQMFNAAIVAFFSKMLPGKVG